MPHPKHPTTLLTGFLGAGKTTFLNALMAWKPDTRFAIIENEVGETGIDGDLIVGADDNLMALNNGCICCSLNDNLLTILQNLHEQSYEWDELLIEATGIADPAGVASPFFNHPAIQKHFELRQVIGLVDGTAIQAQLAADDTAARQIAFSDTLLINKTDQLLEADKQSCRTMLRQSNPIASLHEGHQGHYPMAELLNTDRQAFQASGLAPGASAEQGHAHHEVQALTFRFEEPFDVDLLSNALKAFLVFQAKDVYRIKGVVLDHQRPNRQWIQTVMDTVAVEEGQPWGATEEPASEIVVIGKNLRRKGYERMLRKGLAKNAAS